MLGAASLFLQSILSFIQSIYMARHKNRLAEESSPYLLQHAHNPVDWYPWGEEALARARTENKPILVSIGYSACHWCHVMERESFEDEGTAHFMNEHFINIKIDREERPDLDHIYMDAVQAMTGSGGWPLNVFLTPAGKPFYGGTYFPPERAFNRPSWREILLGVSEAFQSKREQIDQQAEQLTNHLLGTNQIGKALTDQPAAEGLSEKETAELFITLMQNADLQEGGFGRAPKFPQTFSIQFLLHFYYHSRHPQALEHALFSLDCMIQGGIYDQVGGGFARYSTDTEWLVPHFEKMLYDNALLLQTIAEAWQISRQPHYLQTIRQTLRFLYREMRSPEGGFYAALDADSEGVEGRFYVWSREEVVEVIGEEATIFCDFYDITEKGNWEHQNILNIRTKFSEFARDRQIEPENLEKLLERGRTALLQARGARVRPSLDDKILLGWNALLVTAMAKCAVLPGNEYLREDVVKTVDFLLATFSQGGHFHHTYKNGRATQPAFLDDLAALVQALIHVQEISGRQEYLEEASRLTEYIISHFGEEESGFFFYTSANQPDVIVRKKEIYDGATASGNSLMAANLFYLGVVFDRPDWKKRSARMFGALREMVKKYPSSFGVWAMTGLALGRPVPEIALVGDNLEPRRTEFLCTFIPFRVFQSATQPLNQFPLLSGKPYARDAQFYLCQNYSCQSPVFETDALVRLIESV